MEPAHPSSWVAGASSFPAQHFRDQQQEAARINLEAALKYYEESSSDDEEEIGGKAVRGAAHAAHAAGRMAPGGSSGSDDSGSSSGEGDRRSRKRARREKKDGGKKKQKDKKGKRGRRDKGGGKPSDREQVLRAERRALRALGAAALPERRGNAVWATDANRLGAAGPLSLDRDLMFTDKSGDVLNLSYHSLHLGDMPLFRRHDPLGLARGLPSSGAAQAAQAADAFTSGAGVKPMARYFHGRFVLLERSRRLRRIRLRDTSKRPLLAALSGSRSTVATADASEEPEYPGDKAWGKPPAQQQQQQQGMSAGRGRLSLPLPAVLPLEGDPNGGGSAAGGAAPGSLMARSAEEFLRMQAQQGGEGQQAAAGAGGQPAGETVEDWVLRRTREHNVATRERPEDLRLWLGYAEFQAEAAAALAAPGGARSAAAAAAAASAAGKRVAILERALVHHPRSERLMLALLDACEPLVEPEELCSRWQAVLAAPSGGVNGQRAGLHRGSPAVWLQYLRVRMRLFPLFKVPRLQVLLADALHELAVAHAKAREAAFTAAAKGSSTAPDPALASDLEDALVRINLELIRFELDAGCTERAVARVQAVFEFHCFNPNQEAREVLGGAGADGGVVRRPGHYGAQMNQLALFWESGAPRVGEEGAQGWDAWFRHENRHLVALQGRGAGRGRGEEEEVEEKGGGWQGWQELPKSAAAEMEEERQEGEEEKKKAEEMDEDEKEKRGKEKRREGEEGEEGSTEGEGDSEEEEGSEEGEEEEEEEQEEEVNEAELMERLGVKLERDLEAMQERGVEPSVLNRWLQEEQKRDAAQWQPLRPRPARSRGGADASSTDEQQQAADEPGRDASSRVEYDDVAESVFPLERAGLRERLLLGCLALLGVPLVGGPWADGSGGGGLAAPCAPPPAGPWAASNLPNLLDEQQQLFALGGEGVGGGGEGEGAVRGALAGLGWGRPWMWACEGRRAAVARLLRQLLGSGAAFEGHPHLTMAYLLVEAAGLEDWQEAEAGAAAAAQQGSREWAAQQARWRRARLRRADRARDAAAALLGSQRDNAVLAAALGALQAAVGKTGAARKVLDSALASASASAGAGGGGAQQHAQRAPVLPVLALQYADAELAMAAAGATATPVAEARALHVLQWLLEHGCGSAAAASSGSSAVRPQAAFTPFSSSAAGPSELAPEAVTAARAGFAAAVTGWVAESLQAEPPAGAGGRAEAAASAAAVVAAFMMYEVLAARRGVRGGGERLGVGLAGAAAAWRNTAGAAPAPMRARSAPHEWLHVRAARLLVQEQLRHAAAAVGGAAAAMAAALPPAAVRRHLLQALRLYPHNPELLALLESSERAGHAGVRLRQALVRALEAGPSTQLLLAALRAEAGRVAGLGAATGTIAGGGGAAASALAFTALERVFERAVASPQLAGSPVAWQMYFRLEVMAGRLDAARRVLLRAVRECPGCKPLWLEGLRELNGVASPREVSDLLEVAADKGLRLRTDVMEAMLAELAEQAV